MTWPPFAPASNRALVDGRTWMDPMVERWAGFQMTAVLTPPKIAVEPCISSMTWDGGSTGRSDRAHSSKVDVRSGASATAVLVGSLCSWVPFSTSGESNNGSHRSGWQPGRHNGFRSACDHCSAVPPVESRSSPGVRIAHPQFGPTIRPSGWRDESGKRREPQTAMRRDWGFPGDHAHKQALQASPHPWIFTACHHE